MTPVASMHMYTASKHALQAITHGTFITKKSLSEEFHLSGSCAVNLTSCKIICFISHAVNSQNVGQKTGLKPIKYLHKPPITKTYGEQTSWMCVLFKHYRHRSAERHLHLTSNSYEGCCGSRQTELIHINLTQF